MTGAFFLCCLAGDLFAFCSLLLRFRFAILTVSICLISQTIRKYPVTLMQLLLQL